MHGKHPEVGQFILRVGLGALFLAAGLIKLFLMKPSGITGMLDSIGFPAAPFFAWVLILAEIIGGVLLIIGWQVKFASILVGIVILVAILSVQVPALGSEPLQFFRDLAVLVGLVSIYLGGPGNWCLDKKH